MCAGGVLTNSLILITCCHAYLPTSLPQHFFVAFLLFRDGYALLPCFLSTKPFKIVHSFIQPFILLLTHSLTHSFMCRECNNLLIAEGPLRYSSACSCAVQRGLQSIISDLRLLDPNIELRTLRGLWFRYQFVNE